MNLYKELRDLWRSDSIDVSAPATSAEIGAFQERHAVELPEDFIEYLRTSGGMQEGETDKHLICFASLCGLDDSSRWTTLDDTRRGLIFADYSLFAHCYVLDLKSGAVFAADGESWLKLADTFREFIENYLVDPVRVANCWTADVTSK